MSDTDIDVIGWMAEQRHIRGECESNCSICDAEMQEEEERRARIIGDMESDAFMTLDSAVQWYNEAKERYAERVSNDHAAVRRLYAALVLSALAFCRAEGVSP